MTEVRRGMGKGMLYKKWHQNGHHFFTEAGVAAPSVLQILSFPAAKVAAPLALQILTFFEQQRWQHQ
eukprot:1157218-Pelagomonas_calceolata.AAC.9